MERSSTHRPAHSGLTILTIIAVLLTVLVYSLISDGNEPGTPTKASAQSGGYVPQVAWCSGGDYLAVWRPSTGEVRDYKIPAWTPTPNATPRPAFYNGQLVSTHSNVVGLSYDPGCTDLYILLADGSRLQFNLYTGPSLIETLQLGEGPIQ